MVGPVGVDGFRSRGTVRRGEIWPQTRAWRCRPPAKTARTLILQCVLFSSPPPASYSWLARSRPEAPATPPADPISSTGVEIPDFATRAWIVVDGNSGDVLARQNIDEQRPMASTIRR